MTVDILMATYNGARHLRNQLLSLQQQTFTDWVLWVRDDGSTDGTQEIIASFARSDDRVRPVLDGAGLRLGAARNFMGLLEQASAELVIFCDQDDVWFERKLERLHGQARTHFVADIPCCVYCDGYGYSDREGVIVAQSVSPLHATRLEEFLFFNSGYQGCSLMFNRAMRDLVRGYDMANAYMHDDIISLAAHVFGRVYYLPQRLMLYRQHDANLTGNLDETFASRLKRLLRRDSFVISSRHLAEKAAFFDIYRERMDARTCRLFEAYLEFPRRRLPGRLWLVASRGFSLGGHRLPLFVKTLLRRPVG